MTHIKVIVGDQKTIIILLLGREAIEQVSDRVNARVSEVPQTDLHSKRSHNHNLEHQIQIMAD